MSEKNLPAEIEVSRQKPGQLLRQAREKLGMEQKEIASQLNLQTDTIAALEADDNGRLPAPTYVRGYIRSYARIVHLDGNALIGLYDHEAAAPPEIIPDIKQHAQISSNDKPVKAFTYLVTFVLALLLIAWLLQNTYSDKPPVSPVNEKPSASMEEPVATIPENIPAYSTPATELAPYSETEPPSATTEMTTIGQPGLTLDASGLINNIGLPDTSMVIDTPDPESLSAETSATSPGEQPAGDQINLKVIKESWVEIHDAGNNRLYLGLARSGEEISLSGTAPFNVLLGYSPGVQVNYNGKAFDPAPYSTSGVAKFTLGSAAAEEEEQSE